MDRFKSIDLQAERDLMQEMAYIDLNPVKAKLADHPSQWEYSSFHHYAYGKIDPLIDEPEWYLELGKNSKERQKKYLELIETEMLNKGHEIKRSKKMLFIGELSWVNKRTEIIKIHMRKLREQRLLRIKDSKPPPIFNPHLSKYDKLIPVSLPF
jgi:putative transposase